MRNATVSTIIHALRTHTTNGRRRRAVTGEESRSAPGIRLVIPRWTIRSGAAVSGVVACELRAPETDCGPLDATHAPREGANTPADAPARSLPASYADVTTG